MWPQVPRRCSRLSRPRRLCPANPVRQESPCYEHGEADQEPHIENRIRRTNLVWSDISAMQTKKKSLRSRQSPSVKVNASKPSCRPSSKPEWGFRDSSGPPKKKKGYWGWDGQGADGDPILQDWHDEACARSRMPKHPRSDTPYAKHRPRTYRWVDGHYEQYSNPRISRPSHNSPLPSGPLSYNEVDYSLYVKEEEAHLRSPGPQSAGYNRRLQVRSELCHHSDVTANQEASPSDRAESHPASSLGSRPGSRQSVHGDSHPSPRPNSPRVSVEDRPTESALENTSAPDDQQYSSKLMEERTNQFLRELRMASDLADDLRASLGNTKTPTPEKSHSEGEEPECDLRGKLIAKRRISKKVVDNYWEDITSDWSDALSDNRLDAVSAALKECREETDALKGIETGYDCTDTAFEVPSSDLRWSLSAKEEVAKSSVEKDLRASLLAKRRRKSQGEKRSKIEEQAAVPPSCEQGEPAGQFAEDEPMPYCSELNLKPLLEEMRTKEDELKDKDPKNALVGINDNTGNLKLVCKCNINFSFFPNRMRATDFWVADDQPHSSADDVTDAAVEGSAVGSSKACTNYSTKDSLKNTAKPLMKPSIEASIKPAPSKASIELLSKPSTKLSTKTTTKPSTKPSVEATTNHSVKYQPSYKPSTKTSTKVSTKASTKVSTKVPTKVPTKVSTKACTRASTKASTPASTKASTKTSAHASTKASTKISTKTSTQASTKASTKTSAHASTKASTKISTKTSTQASTKASTKTSSLSSTKASTRATNKGFSKPSTKCTAQGTSNQVTSDITKDSTVTAENGTMDDDIVMTDVPTFCSTNAPTKPSKASTSASTKPSTCASFKPSTSASTKPTKASVKFFTKSFTKACSVSYTKASTRARHKGTSKAPTKGAAQGTTKDGTTSDMTKDSTVTAENGTISDDIVFTEVNTCSTNAPTDKACTDQQQIEKKSEATPVNAIGVQLNYDPVYGTEGDTFVPVEMNVSKTMPKNGELVTSEEPKIKKIRKGRKRCKKQAEETEAGK